MDLVPEDQKDNIFKEREGDLKKLSLPLDCTCYRTSIWDETLYRAWSNIVYMLIPNVETLENSLKHFAEIIDAVEVLLFERATFLVISHYQRTEHRDSHRFEKVSNIIKQFKLSCSKLGAKFQSIEVSFVHCTEINEQVNRKSDNLRLILPLNFTFLTQTTTLWKLSEFTDTVHYIRHLLYTVLIQASLLV